MEREALQNSGDFVVLQLNAFFPVQLSGLDEPGAQDNTDLFNHSIAKQRNKTYPQILLTVNQRST